ncbi:MAG: glycosyltransferase family 4 protein [Myxococcales bacterium]|nr:glycosyltransferase family 4 protein [Myxococcales bacterium]
MARSQQMDRRPTLVILSQVYPPDPASVGQHLHEVARECVRRGYRVRVVTSARGYDDPSVEYPLRETSDGVEIGRIPLGSLGKRSIAARLAGGALFLLQATARVLAFGRVDQILISTSPPIVGPAGVLLRLLRRAPLCFWVMDINPDQAVARGLYAEDAWPVRALDAAVRVTLRQAQHIVTLDRFMAERLVRKLPVMDKITLIPPWPLAEQSGDPVAHADNAFRQEHGLSDKLVVMYSGNMSLTHPLTTILEAADRLKARTDIAFVFVGGGNGRAEVEAFAAAHPDAQICLLPYQPLAMLHISLSAADIHVVSMGDDQVGLVHPCKVYGAMAVARPVFFVGPAESHVGDILAHHDVGWTVAHGQVDEAVQILTRLADGPRSILVAAGVRARKALDEHFSRALQLPRFCDLIAPGLGE